MKKSLLTTLAFIFLLIESGNSFGQITSAATGNWGDAATWVGGVVPSATTDVVVASGHVVTIDLANAACKNLSIDGSLFFPDVDARAINVFGNLTVNATGKFVAYGSGNPTGTRNHNFLITGDITVISGGVLDMRKGSGSNVGVVTVTFSGSTTSNITLTQTTYSSSVEEFNSVTISKVQGAKVILKAGNLYQSNNSSTAATILTLTSGIVETQGSSIWGFLSTSSTNLVGDFTNSYFNGALGRGLSNTSGNFAKREFPVGDANGYRPVTIRATAGLVSGHLLVVQPVSGTASNNSTFAGGIDRVSSVRYYKVTYTKSGTGAAASVNLDTLGISYAAGDGVAAGNTNLRVAYSTNDRALWTGVPQTVAHTTTLTTPPTTIIADQLTTPITLAAESSCFIALARVSGTTENTLTGTGVSVEKEEGIPTSFDLSQNYPNPFNPSTSISFSIPQSAFVTLRVYDITGKQVASLVNEQKDAGNYRFNFDATKFASGIYLYRIQAGNFVSTKKMVLMK